MQDTISRQQPYHFRVPAHQTAAEMHVGWRSIKVNVRDLSWADITITLPSSMGQRIKTGCVCKLLYQGSTWQTCVESIAHEDTGETKVVLRRTEPCGTVTVKNKFAHDTLPPAEQRLAGDPVVYAIGIVSILVALLVLPGWGEELGTSEPITDFFSGLFSFLR